jgi:hypothetical protein
LVGELDRLRWTEVIRTADPELELWIRGLAGAPIKARGLPGFLGWAVGELRSVIRAETRSRLGGRIFEPDPEELAEVAVLLRAKIPPAQRQTGASVARESIILACWHAAMANGGGGPVALAAAPDAPELKELLPAALELSAVAAAWGAQ